MGNKGAYITLTGGDLTPKYTSYAAVVSLFMYQQIQSYKHFLETC